MTSRSKKQEPSSERALRLARRGMGPAPGSRGAVDRALVVAGVALPATLLAATAKASAGAAAGAAAKLGGSGVGLGAAVGGGAEGVLGTVGAVKALAVAVAITAVGVGARAGYQVMAEVPASEVRTPGSLRTLETARITERVALPSTSVPALSPSPSVASTGPASAASPGAVAGSPTETSQQAARKIAAVPPPALAPTLSAASLMKAELAALRQVQTALAQGDGATALRLLRALDRDMPGGGLGPERRVSEVLALCQIGQTEAASRLARQLLAREGAFYRNRLQESCVSGETEKEFDRDSKSLGGGN